MCLVTPTKKAYTAETDIYCYKVLNECGGQLTTPFRGFPVELGKIYTTEHVSEVDNNMIEGGFLHAYASPSYMYMCKQNYADPSKNTAMYLAVIPKGAKFYTNNDCTELCATALKVISKIADLNDKSLFSTIATDVEENYYCERSGLNKTFINYKDSLTTMEDIVKFAKDNDLYANLVSKYEVFEEGSYEKNLYAYRLIVAVLTENEKNSLVNGNCYYPYVRFYTGRGLYKPDNWVKIGTVISDGISYIVIGGYADYGTYAGLGDFHSDGGVSLSNSTVGFRSVSSREIAQFISRYFGKIVFDLVYDCAGCNYHWVMEND